MHPSAIYEPRVQFMQFIVCSADYTINIASPKLMLYKILPIGNVAQTSREFSRRGDSRIARGSFVNDPYNIFFYSISIASPNEKNLYFSSTAVS